MVRLRPRFRVPSGFLLGDTLFAVLLAALLGAAQAAAPLALTVVSETPLGATPSPATNVRFASPTSIYLSRLYDGVTLTGLTGTPVAERQVMAGSKATGMLSFERLAASADYLVASSPYNTLAFRPVAGAPGNAYPLRRLTVGIIEALDLKGDDLLVLGIPERFGPVAPTGALVWIGSVSRVYAKTAKPVLIGVRGSGARHLDNCSGLALGAVRFLGDGSYLVVPGVEPGAILYGPKGNVLRRWTSQEIGIDTDCTNLPDKQGDDFHKVKGERFRFLNAHRVVDAILPLAAGPGVVVRSVAAGRVHWSLSLLGAGGVLSVELPFTGALDERLRGDAAGNRIVFLKGPADFHPGSTYAGSTLIVADLSASATTEGAP
jgi:hypothetical protein